MTQNLLETLTPVSSLTFQLSNVRELETVKYAFDCGINHGLLDGIPGFQLNKLNGNIDRTFTASSPFDRRQRCPRKPAEAIERHIELLDSPGVYGNSYGSSCKPVVKLAPSLIVLIRKTRCLFLFVKGPIHSLKGRWVNLLLCSTPCLYLNLPALIYQAFISTSEHLT